MCTRVHRRRGSAKRLSMQYQDLFSPFLEAVFAMSAIDVILL